MSSESIAITGVREPSRPIGAILHTWITTVDHKRIGILYILYALVFLVIGGMEATIMRIQLIVPHNHFVSPEFFNQMFTMHGTTMIFFVAMPILFGFGNYLVPLMIGARDMAFPRLNAFSFWLSAFGGFLLYFSFIGGNGLYGAGGAPDVGWWAYAPLTSKAFSIGHSTEFWTLGLILAGFGSIGTAVNFVATILCMRCPGMTLGRMPLLAWLNLVTGAMVLFAISPLTAAQIMLCLDRFLDAHFFDTQAGGSAVLWMHFFWIFGHPEVYVLVIPAFAFISEIVPVFSRKPIFGYPVMVAATVGIGFVSFSVWAHHMFTIGMNSYANTFFTISTMVVGIPTGIKIFNWLGTMWGGKLDFQSSSALLHRLSFSVPDRGSHRHHARRRSFQLAAQQFLLRRRSFSLRHRRWHSLRHLRRLLLLVPQNERPAATTKNLASFHFWLFVIGFHLTFDFMHIPGILGMPRRIYTYEPGRGWEIWNVIVTIGVFFQIAGTLVFVANLLYSIFRGAPAGNDPWDAWTLEWSTSSPPPDYNFASVPVVNSRRPLWDIKHPEDPDWRYE